MKRPLALLLVALALLAAGLAGRARAAGLARPNVLGARAIGLGGAFSAVADDPTAVWHNPAGTAFYGDTSIYVGGELVFLGRTLTPDPTSPIGMGNATAGTPNRTVTENTPPTFLPVIGGSTRFGFGRLKPNRFALSLLAYLVYGGSISYDPKDVHMLGIQSTQIIDYEIAPTLAYQVSDVLALGAAVRIGINSFSVTDNESAFKANLSALGVGIGGTLGVMVRPHRIVQLGLVYRTPLSSTMTGGGDLTVAGKLQRPDMSVSITWPQSAALAISVRPHPRVMLTLQGDWTGWSSVQKLSIDITGFPSQVRPFRYGDSWAAHLGVQGVVTRFLLLRAGLAYDSNAIPASAFRRENQDSNKATAAIGFGLHFWKLFIDGAFESLLPLGPRVISPQMGTDNEAGSYDARVYTAELSAQIRF